MTKSVIPAKAGIKLKSQSLGLIPACAGMTLILSVFLLIVSAHPAYAETKKEESKPGVRVLVSRESPASSEKTLAAEMRTELRGAAASGILKSTEAKPVAKIQKEKRALEEKKSAQSEKRRTKLQFFDPGADDRKTEYVTKTVQGRIAGVSFNGVAVEYSRDAATGMDYEMWFDFVKDMKVSGVESP